MWVDAKRQPMSVGNACTWCLQASLRGETQLAVLQALVRFFRLSLARLCKGAEDMRDLASPHWAPRVAAYVNSAHFLQQALQVLLCHHYATLASWLRCNVSAGKLDTCVHSADFLQPAVWVTAL